MRALPASQVRYSELAAGELLTPAEVAAWLKITVRQVQRLGVPYEDLGKRSRRYLVGDVKTWLERRRKGVAA